MTATLKRQNGRLAILTEVRIETWILKTNYKLKIKLELFDTTSIIHPSFTRILSGKCWWKSVIKKHEKCFGDKMYGANCTTGCFHKSTPPQPSTILLQKKSRNSAMTKQSWREREREREREKGGGGWEGYVQYYSFKKGSGQPLDNCDREKVNRGWHWHQERNGKNSFNEKFNSCARVCQNFVAVTCHETTQNR